MIFVLDYWLRISQTLAVGSRMKRSLRFSSLSSKNVRSVVRFHADWEADSMPCEISEIFARKHFFNGKFQWRTIWEVNILCNTNNFERSSATEGLRNGFAGYRSPESFVARVRIQRMAIYNNICTYIYGRRSLRVVKWSVDEALT